MNLRKSLLCCTVCAAWLSAAGCIRTQPDIHIPLQRTAAEQYAYAVQFRQGREVEIVTDDDKYMLAREIVKQTFARVYEYFPEDREFTPLARLEVIEYDCGLDSGRAAGIMGRKIEQVAPRGIERFAQLALDYPENEFVQAKSLYQRGQLYKRMGSYDQAQQMFGEMRDRFMNHPQPEIHRLAQRADYFYNRTYINP